MLATLGVPLDPAASAFAVESAVEAGRELIVINVTRLEPLRLSIVMGYDALPELTPEVTASLRRTTQLARSIGVQVERLRIRSPRPIEALVETVRDRAPGLLVFGADRSALRPRRFGRAVDVIRGSTECLVWVEPPAEPDGIGS